MRRLYFRIYLAVLGSIALFAILVGLSGWAFHELREPDNTGPQSPFISDVAEHPCRPAPLRQRSGRSWSSGTTGRSSALRCFRLEARSSHARAPYRIARSRISPAPPRPRACIGIRMAPSRSSSTAAATHRHPAAAQFWPPVPLALARHRLRHRPRGRNLRLPPCQAADQKPRTVAAGRGRVRPGQSGGACSVRGRDEVGNSPRPSTLPLAASRRW